MQRLKCFQINIEAPRLRMAGDIAPPPPGPRLLCSLSFSEADGLGMTLGLINYSFAAMAAIGLSLSVRGVVFTTQLPKHT